MVVVVNHIREQESSGQILARLCQPYFIQGPIRALNPILDGTTEYMHIYSVCRGNVCPPDFVLEYALLSTTTSAAPAPTVVRAGPSDDNLALGNSHVLRLRRCCGALDTSVGAKEMLTNIEISPTRGPIWKLPTALGQKSSNIAQLGG